MPSSAPWRLLLLPELSILDPKFLGASADHHAPTDIRMGQAFVLAVYNMLKQTSNNGRRCSSS